MPRVPSYTWLVRGVVIVALAGAFAIAPVPPARAAGTFTELFTGTAFEDPLATTAAWDTATGRLHLYPFVPILAGGYDTPGSALDVAQVGKFAYVADGTAGLEIYDVSNPASPVLVGNLALPGTAYNVFVRGTTAYVADGVSGLKIVNVANPASPALLGTYSGVTVRDVVVTGMTALLACDAAGFRCVSITTPAAPALLGSLSTASNAYGVAVSGLTAYVATNTTGVLMVSVSPPTTPTLLGTYNTPGTAVGVAAAGLRVYVADGASGVEILDASNPAAPTLLGTFASAGAANGVTVEGTMLYVASSDAGLQVVNASNPASPVLLNACDTPGNANAVALDNDYAFVADNASGLTTVRIGTRQRPRPGIPFLSTSANRLAVAGNFLYTAGSTMQILDVSNHAGPTLTGSYPIGGGDGAMDVAVSGPRAYLAVLNGGLRIVNIANPASPTLMGSYTGVTGWGVAVSGSVAYMATGSTGLKIINATVPSSPTLLGTYDTPGYAEAVAVVGTVAYVADGDSGLKVINVSNLSLPTLITTVPTAGFVYEVTVSGSLAFVSMGGLGVQIIDVSNPASAHVVGAFTEPGHPIRDVVISGSLAYMLADGIDVVDVSNPSVPILLSRYGDYPNLIDPTGAAVCGSLLYATDPSNTAVQTFETVQQRFDSTRVTGQSRAVNRGQWLDMAKISSTNVDSVAWELTLDGGVNWASMFQLSYWTQFSLSRDLRWRATVYPVPPSATATPPEASSFTVSWNHSFARIDSIWDVRNDQGGKLRLRFERSYYDLHFDYDPIEQVTGYEIYHRIDDAAFAEQILAGSSRPDPASLGPGLAPIGASSLRRWGDRTFVRGGGEEALVDFPPGLWEAMTWMPALGIQEYYALMPTTVDSAASGSGWSVFFVAGLTASPYLWYASPPESGQAVDNLAPNVPTGFAASYQPGSGSALNWNAATDADFRYFKIYRGTVPGFTPGPGSLLHSTIETNWLDGSFPGGTVYYKLTAVDFAGNESAPASAIVVAGVDDAVMPASFALHPPAPNPFHGALAIAFDVPAAGGRVEIGIFDVSGRRVRSLVDGSKPGGKWQATWDGRDGLGRTLLPGVYLCRMRAGKFSKVVKVSLSR
jgi:hypothetical protein